MKTWRKVLFICAVAVQIGLLAYMALSREYLLHNGKVIKLQCKPVDPRSLFSGDYVRLSYEISSFSGEVLEKVNAYKETFKEHDIVYVGLKEDAETHLWNAVMVTHERKHLTDENMPFIRGKVASTYTLRITYGVEEYFVPQYEGLKIENNIENVTVDVVLASDGDSAIKLLYLNNKPVRLY